MKSDLLRAVTGGFIIQMADEPRRPGRLATNMENRKLAILLSGRGSNFTAIREAIQRGDLRAEICCVLSNIAEAPGLARAREFGYLSLCLPSKEVERVGFDRRG